MKTLLFKIFTIFWRFERLLANDRVRTWLGVNLRRAFWSTRLRKLGPDTRIGTNVIIHQPDFVEIGENSSVAEFVHIWGGGGVTIGNSVLIASHVSITSMTHDASAATFAQTLVKKPVVISDNVWIGTGAKILPGVHLGTGSIVAAGAVVTRDVPANSIVAGVPAKLTRGLATARD